MTEDTKQPPEISEGLGEQPLDAPPPNQPRYLRTLAGLALAAAAAGLLLAAVSFWRNETRLRDIELQLARRIGEFDASSREARAAAKDARSVSEALVARITALENKAMETQNQQLALSSMYQELARSQDERLLADIEQGLLLAQQQLHLAGNARAAIAGLEALSERLGKLDKPQFARLREAIAFDAAQLRLLPSADVVGINARLDTMIENVDKLPLESDLQGPAAKPAPEGTLRAGLTWLERLREDAWDEIKQLIRIRRMDHPELPVLAPNQAYFLRQNLKLRLLAARLNLLQRDETSFRGDLSAAESWLTNYFDMKDPLSQGMLDNLKTLRMMPVASKDVDIQASLKALKTTRSRAP
jgi:uroporphyrin-3 C-methyltransferase